MKTKPYKAKTITGAQARVRMLENALRETRTTYESICNRMKAEHQKRLEAIHWALGVNGEFRTRGEDEGPYYWRNELLERSGITGDELQRLALAMPSSLEAE